MGASATGGSSNGAPPPSTGGTTLPPEREVESFYESPVATSNFVWIANPESGRVAFVDASSVTVRTVEAGNGPRYLAVVPGQADEVVVLNTLSHDASLLQATAAGAITATAIPGMPARANSWAVSADGHWAVAWADARRVQDAQGKPVSLPLVEGLQDVAVIELGANPAAKTLAVGYRPVSVSFAADSGTAYVVTEDGLSVIDLEPRASGGSKLVRSLPLGSGDGSANARDVSLTPRGDWALVRQEGSSTLTAVDTRTGAVHALTLSAPVTDLDVDASGAQAVAVLRDAAEVDLIPVPGAFTQGTPVQQVSVAGQLVGSAVLAANKAILFTNAVASDRLVTMDLRTGAIEVARVHAPIYTALPTGDGLHALVLHAEGTVPSGTGGAGPRGGAGGQGGSSVGGAATAAGGQSGAGAAGSGMGGSAAGAGGTGSGGQGGGHAGQGSAGGNGGPTHTGGAAAPGSTGGMGQTASSGGTGGSGSGSSAPLPLVLGKAFSIVPLTGSLPARIQGMNAAPQSTAFAPDGTWALVTERDDAAKTYGVYVAQMPSLQIDRLTLSSPPLAVGLVAPAKRGYVTQLHPEGRVSFVAFGATGTPELRTLTGFELGARVVSGTSP